MKTKSFAQEEISGITQALINKKVTQSEIDLVVSALNKYKTTGKPTHPTRGLKIALKRAGNKLGVSYEINVNETDKTVRLSNFTGNKSDGVIFSGIATKFGYTTV
jgi:hypothetical protein